MIRYRKEKNLAVLTITGSCNTLERLGALSGELADLKGRIMSDDEIRVILLNGSGRRAFDMGGDLLRKCTALSEEAFHRIPDPSVSLANIDRPVIAGIDGDAQGLGLEMALACDIRIAADTSRFGLPHIKEGFIPWSGGTQRLPRLVGKAKAMEMILSGHMIDAREALRIGLVNKVVPSKEVFQTAKEIAQQMASKAPIALRYTKEAVNKGMDLTLEQGLRLEADLYFLMHTTQDRVEGIKAFQEKQKAQFKGR